MTTKDVVDAILRVLEILVSWPVILLVVLLMVRRQLPVLLTKLADRVTKAPGGFEFAVLQEQIKGLATKVDEIEEKLAFTAGSRLPTDLKGRIEQQWSRYRAYLQGLGYRSEHSDFEIEVTDEPKVPGAISYYDPNSGRMVIVGRYAEDTDAVLREYTHRVLLGDGAVQDVVAYIDIEYALAAYFPCSFKNSPRLGEKMAPLLGLDKPYVWNLANDRTFDPSRAETTPGSTEATETWGGAFWEVRSDLGRDVADRLLFDTWFAAQPPPSKGGFDQSFVTKLLEKAQANRGAVKAVFDRRGYKK